MNLAIAIVFILAGFGALVLIEIVFDTAWMLVQKGWTHHEAGQPTEAFNAFSRALHLKPKNKWAIAGIAQ